MDLNEVTFKRRHPIALQLAPMIDIFTLIIVFLLKSTVVADISIVFPSELQAPKSLSQESLETFPEVFVYHDRVELPFMKISKKFVELEEITDEELSRTKKKVADYIKVAAVHSKASLININMLSGKNNKYKTIYSAVKYLRQIGFQSVLFIAESGQKQ